MDFYFILLINKTSLGENFSNLLCYHTQSDDFLIEEVLTLMELRISLYHESHRLQKKSTLVYIFPPRIKERVNSERNREKDRVDKQC